MPSFGPVDSQTQLQELHWALQALAQPADVQLTLFPDFACKTDELALDFDDWAPAVLQCPEIELTEPQRTALQHIDEAFTKMNAEGTPIWTDDALRSAPEWEQARSLARQALAAFAWPPDAPPLRRGAYVPAGRQLGA